MRHVVIVGSGCAGNTAAIYTARANLKPLVIAGTEAGGQLSLTTEVENYPGFPEGIQGPDLVENMKKQAQRFGAEWRSGDVTKADLSKRPFKLWIGAEEIETEALIMASGASARWLGIPNEQKLIGHGVSSCATCDGFFFRDEPVAVIGGGDSAMEEATFLTKFASEVTLIHRRDEFRASKIMLDRAQKNKKIKWMPNTVVEDVYDVSQNSVTGLKLRKTDNGETWDHETKALFLAIGHIPNTKFLGGQIELDKEGYIISHGGAKTNIPGVFHAGDVQDRVYRQAVTASGMGCMAAIEAERFLES
jgi:thioredoxin reductase (NADPH)